MTTMDLLVDSSSYQWSVRSGEGHTVALTRCLESWRENIRAAHVIATGNDHSAARTELVERK